MQERVQHRGFKKRLILITISAVLSAITMPGMISSIFVWFGLVPFLFALKGLKWWKSLLWSWYFGILYIGIALYWLVPTLTQNISEFNGFPSFLGIIAFFLMTIIEGGFFAIFGMLYNLIDKFGFDLSLSSKKPPKKHNWHFYLSKSLIIIHAMSFAGLYTLMEYLRGFGEIGFTGARLSDALYSQIGIVQIVSFSGTLGLTFLIVFMNYMLYTSLRKKRWHSLVTLCIIIVGFYSFSFFVPQFSKYKGRKIPIGVVQTNVSVAQRYHMSSSNIVQQVDNAITKLSRTSTLIVFPEGTFPYDFTKGLFYTKVISILKSKNVHIVLGYPSTLGQHFYNSAGLFGPNGLEGLYSKHILVPFTETLPYPKLFGLFGFLKLTQFFNPGSKFTIFKWNNTAFSVQICFESYFGWLSRKFTNEGARFLITITNDSWFSQHPALVQHFAQTVFRAVENRKWVIQVADTGITGVVDPYGHIVKKLPTDSTVMTSFFVIPNGDRTFYDRFGNWILWFSIGLIGLDLVIRIIDDIIKKRERNV